MFTYSFKCFSDLEPYIIKNINGILLSWLFRAELDDLGDPDHYQERFTTIVNIFVAEDERSSTKQPPWTDHAARNITPDCLFSTRIEKDENFDTFGKQYKYLNTFFVYITIKLMKTGSSDLNEIIMEIMVVLQLSASTVVLLALE